MEISAKQYQAVCRGRVTAKDCGDQFYKKFEWMADAIGVSCSKLNDMLCNGQIIPNMLIDKIKDLPL